jgi:glycosyltransferase involved in cell wall biosynthesis
MGLSGTIRFQRPSFFIPLKVLVVSHACVVDANQTLYRWIEQSADIELQIIAPQTWKTDLRGHLPLQRLPSLRSRIVALRPIFNGRGSLHFYLGAAACVAEFRPELIFLDEEPWSLCALQFAALAQRCEARLVFYTKENLHRKYPFPFRWIERHVLGRTALAAVISDEAGAVLSAKGYRGPTVNLPHGFEPEWFQPRGSAEQRHAQDLQGVVIGYVGRLAPEKGITDLIDAASQIHAAQPATRFTVLLIGSGPQETELKDLVAHRGLSGVVKFLPAVPHNQIAEYYNCLDVLVVPSRTTVKWKEQFGRVLIEAMASGVCVVGSDSGEIPTVIGDGGLVFAEGNVARLTSALRSLIADAGLRRRLGAAGRARAVARYSNTVIADQLVSAWRAAVN